MPPRKMMWGQTFSHKMWVMSWDVPQDHENKVSRPSDSKDTNISKFKINNIWEFENH